MKTLLQIPDGDLAEYRISGKPRDWTLEALLDAMSCRGGPSLRRHDDGAWSCSVDMFVSATGASFKVRSDFDHGTHIEAATVCHERMLEALRVLEEGSA